MSPRRSPAGHSFLEPSDVELDVLWQAAGVDASALYVSRCRLSWPDGSEFVFDLSYDEVKILRQAEL